MSKSSMPETLEFIASNSNSYKIALCLLREPAGVVSQGRIYTTRYRGVYQVEDLASKTKKFAVIDDYQTDFGHFALVRKIKDRLFDLFDDNGEFALN